jgi:hypothetical protein
MLTSLRTELLPSSRAEPEATTRATAVLLLRLGLAFLATAAVFFGLVGATAALGSTPPRAPENCSLALGWRCDGPAGCCADDLVCVAYTREFARCEAHR